ncbi:MAG: AMP-dependent synthetase, partial [Pseudomonadota bacterium]
VMMGYLDSPQETADTLKQHADGRIWLHTGDIGTMDEDGFFYFKLRQKRMIKSSGMNVYPAQVEEIFYKHPKVRDACVVGVRLFGIAVDGFSPVQLSELRNEGLSWLVFVAALVSCPRQK